MTDACLFGELNESAPLSLACDYGGFYPAHWCANWGPDTQAILDGCESVADLRRVWERLELGGYVDGFGGSEYHHALSHLRHKLGMTGMMNAKAET